MEGEYYLRFSKLQPVPQTYTNLIFLHWKCGGKEGNTDSIKEANNSIDFKHQTIRLVVIIYFNI
jgi:hypothetical protein